MNSPDNAVRERFNEGGYARLIETLRVVAGAIVLEVLRQDDRLSHRIICDLVARAMSSLLSVEKLWKLGHFEDAWVVNRTIMERLFLLSHLAETHSFDQFEEWSFLKQVKALHRLKTDPEFREKVSPDELVIEPEQWKRFLSLNKKGVSWTAPKPENIAKKLGMTFLYDYGYDYASRFIHPRAGDGQDAIQRLVRKDWAPDPRHQTVLQNSILATTMILQQSLNATHLRWNVTVFDFLEQARESLVSSSFDYGVSFLTIVELIQSRQLSKTLTSTD